MGFSRAAGSVVAQIMEVEFQSPKSGQWDSLYVDLTEAEEAEAFQSPKSGQWDSLVEGLVIRATGMEVSFNPLNRGNGILSFVVFPYCGSVREVSIP